MDKLYFVPGCGSDLAVLAPGRLGAGERVFPAEPVPVIDMEGQRQHFRSARQPGEQRIGRRTGRTALGGEQLDHDRAFPRLYRRDAERETKRNAERACLDHAARLH